MAEELSDEELQTLLTAAGNKGQLAGDNTLANTPLAYDFKRPQRVNKEQLRIIENSSIYDTKSVYIQGGLIEEILQDKKHHARKDLIWQNPCFLSKNRK